MIGPIKKLLGGNSYYLELDESKSAANEPTIPAAAIEEKPEPVKVETVKSEPMAAPPEVEAQPEPVKAKTAKPSRKKAAAKVSSEAPVTVSPSTSNPLEIIKAAVQKPTTTAEAKSESNEATFAPDYLLYTKTQAKRRPGACMSSFLDMARQRR